ncbi:MAG: hypothetical protein RMX68_000165 [Aulosira sp. ZfuVER01]|nr:hypothetical protein [Aulosira sp. ZfuVER01]MDZ8001932.1 hypothetical protein [Aulosira sp. DedVER01a]
MIELIAIAHRDLIRIFDMRSLWLVYERLLRNSSKRTHSDRYLKFVTLLPSKY